MRLEVAGRLEELAAQSTLELLLVRVHEVVARVEVAPGVHLAADLARLRRPPLALLPLLGLVLVDHLVALDVGDGLRREAALLVPALVEYLPRPSRILGDPAFIRYLASSSTGSHSQVWFRFRSLGLCFADFPLQVPSYFSAASLALVQVEHSNQSQPNAFANYTPCIASPHLPLDTRTR